MGLLEKLLNKSASVRGFFLPQYADQFSKHFAKLEALLEERKLKVSVDQNEFRGVFAVADAVDRLQSGKSVGKVVLRLAQSKEDEHKILGEFKTPSTTDDESSNSLSSKL